jgi:CRP/FNR family transcriptional regulator, cyclic AMP receptor protein
MTDAPIDFRILAGAGVPVREFKAGDVIFSHGDDAKELFVIQNGTVEIRLGNRVIETLSDYNIFGEMALIDAAPRSATAVAVTDVKLVPVAEKQFLFLISHTPSAIRRISRSMFCALWRGVCVPPTAQYESGRCRTDRHAARGLAD